MQRIRRRLVRFTKDPIGSNIIGGVIGSLVLALATLALPVGWLPSTWSWIASILTTGIKTPTWVALVVLIALITIGGYAIRTRKILYRSATPPPFHRDHNGLSLPTGFILVIRASGFTAALQALDQRTTSTTPLIEYGWWYLAHGSAQNFRSPDVEMGVQTVHEGNPLQLGPLVVPWSFGADGSGWVYFGDQMKPPIDYTLALSNEVDISKVEIGSLTFERYIENKEWHRSLHAS